MILTTSAARPATVVPSGEDEIERMKKFEREEIKRPALLAGGADLGANVFFHFRFQISPPIRSPNP